MHDFVCSVKSHRGIITQRRVSGSVVPQDQRVRGKMSTITYDAVATDTGGVSVTNKAPEKRPVVAGDGIVSAEDQPEVEAADVGQECSISVFGDKVRLYVQESLILEVCGDSSGTPNVPIGGTDPVDPPPRPSDPAAPVG